MCDRPWFSDWAFFTNGNLIEIERRITIGRPKQRRLHVTNLQGPRTLPFLYWTAGGRRMSVPEGESTKLRSKLTRKEGSKEIDRYLLPTSTYAEAFGRRSGGGWNPWPMLSYIKILHEIPEIHTTIHPSIPPSIPPYVHPISSSYSFFFLFASPRRGLGLGLVVHTFSRRWPCPRLSNTV